MNNLFQTRLKKITSLFIVLMLMLSALTLSACNDTQRSNFSGIGADVYLGSFQEYITEDRVVELVSNWVTIVREGGLTDFSMNVSCRYRNVYFYVSNNNAIHKTNQPYGHSWQKHNIFIYNVDLYEEINNNCHVTQYVTFNGRLQNLIKNRFISAHIILNIGVAKFIPAPFVARRYEKGYRIIVTHREACDEYILWQDVLAFDLGGRLLGHTEYMNSVTVDGEIIPWIITHSVTWERPNEMLFPINLGEFIRPCADIVSGIEVLSVEYSGVIDKSVNILARAILETGRHTHNSWQFVYIETCKNAFFPDGIRLVWGAATLNNNIILLAETATITIRSKVNPDLYIVKSIQVVYNNEGIME